jgi:hypothetical protein
VTVSGNSLTVSGKGPVSATRARPPISR